MNKDQAKGKIKDVAGKAQEKIGEATGSTEQRVKGMGKQVAGKTQEGAGDVKEAAKNLKKDRS
jgi:uncharacterized protein YjbJ (UPF0337 family)